jgi:hypothetical protein
MSATSLNLGINHLSLPNQNSVVTSTSSFSSKISNASKLYLGPGYTNLPGITNLFYAPHEFIKSIKAILKAEKINDQEGVLENGLRVVSTPFSFLNSLAQLAWYILEGGIYFKILSAALQNSLAPLTLAISVVGFIICSIEGVLETYGLIRTKQFYSRHFPFELESFKKIFNITDPVQRQQKFLEFLEKFPSKSELPIEVRNEIETFLRRKDYSNEEFSILSTNLLNQIEKNIFLKKLQRLHRTYLQISPEEMNGIERYVQKKFRNISPPEQQQKKENIIKAELNRRKNDLVRRVQPWLANEMSQNVPEIIQNLQSADSLTSKQAKEKAAEIFNHIKMQSQKKFLIHGIGLTAVLITIAGLILSYVACPLFIPFTVLIIGGILAFARYYLNVGLIDSKDWEFKIENCIPSFIRAIFKKQKEHKVAKPVPLALDFDLIRSNSLSLENNFHPKNHFNFTITVPVGTRV